jgi:hypothetical protein
LRDEQWTHIQDERPELAPFERAIMETITHPDDRKPDPRPGRERCYSDSRGPSRWLRVIVGITLVNAKWLVERDGKIDVTVRVDADELAPALT